MSKAFDDLITTAKNANTSATEDKSSDEASVVEEKEPVAAAASDETPAEETPEEGEATGEVEEPAYQPNYKFKVLDQEKEFDEWIRQAVNKDNEAKIRELYEKAYGIDHVKTQRDQEREARAKAQAMFDQLAGEIQEAGELKQKDLGLFFERLGIPMQDVINYVWQKAEIAQQIENLPDHIKQVYNKTNSQEGTIFKLQKQVEHLGSLQERQVVQARAAELNSVLSTPEIQTIVSQYDSRLGQPGSFEKMVKRHAAAEFDSSRGERDLTPKQAVDEVIKILGLTPQAGQPVAAAQSPRVVSGAKPTVLPNVGSGTATPTAVKRPSSIAELKKISQKMRMAGG